MNRKRLALVLAATVLAAAFAGCGGSSDSSSGKGKSSSEKKTESSAKQEQPAEEQESTSSGKEEVVESNETYSYNVAGAELEMNVDLDKYLDTDTNIFNMVQMGQDMGYNETIKDKENSFGVRLGTGSSLYSGYTVDVLLSDKQAAVDVDGSELTPYKELTVSWAGDSEGSCKVVQQDVTQARYTIGKSQDSVSYEMIILIAYAMNKERVQAGEDPFESLLEGTGGSYTIPGTEESAADENEEFVEGVTEEEPVVIEDTTEEAAESEEAAPADEAAEGGEAAEGAEEAAPAEETGEGA